MSYGHLSPLQKQVLKRFVSRRVVHDLGAGDLGLAAELVRLRAAGVVAIETDIDPDTRVPENVKLVRKSFTVYDESIRTAFVSWPWSYDHGALVRLIKDAPTVIYLGKNTDGVVCGDPSLWAHLCTRRVLAHEPHPANVLVVYGRVDGERDLLPEEAAAIDMKKIHHYMDVYWKGSKRA